MAATRDLNIVPDKDDNANHPEKQMTGGALGTGKEQQGDQPNGSRPKSDQASVVAPTPQSVKDLPAGQGLTLRSRISRATKSRRPTPPSTRATAIAG